MSTYGATQSWVACQKLRRHSLLWVGKYSQLTFLSCVTNVSLYAKVWIISCLSCVNCSAFSQKHLGQIHTVYPTAYKFQQEKDLPMFGGKVCGYQLTIEAILDATSDDNGMAYLVLAKFWVLYIVLQNSCVYQYCTYILCNILIVFCCVINHCS